MFDCAHVYVYTTSVRSSVDGRLGGFHVPAAVNGAAVNAGVRVSFHTSVFIFSRCLPGSGVARLCVSSVARFLGKLLVASRRGCPSLPSHQQGAGFSFPASSPVVVNRGLFDDRHSDR